MQDERFKSEMMRLMGTVINKLDGLESDVSTLKSDVSTLKSDVSTLKSDVSEIKSVQKEHSLTLKRLDAKTENIAETVINHEIRLTKVEKDVEEIRSGVH